MNKTGLRNIFYEAISNLTTTASFPLAISLAVIQATGALVGRMALPQGEKLHVGNIFGQLLSWDGRWYYSIGTTGYTWNPATSQTQYQNIAFFLCRGLSTDSRYLLRAQTQFR